MRWEDYKSEHCDPGGAHHAHPDWQTTDYPWELRRRDGVITVHRMNSPFGGPGSQQRSVEWSMRLADKHLQPLGETDRWPVQPDGWGEVDYDKLAELEEGTWEG